jgi:hypothetical protein
LNKNRRLIISNEPSLTVSYFNFGFSRPGSGRKAFSRTLISEERKYSIVEQPKITGAKIKIIIALAKASKRKAIDFDLF